MPCKKVDFRSGDEPLKTCIGNNNYYSACENYSNISQLQ